MTHSISQTTPVAAAPQVRLVTLAPARALRAFAFGPQPEEPALAALQALLAEAGLTVAQTGGSAGPHRIFGFNNPNPAAGSPNYGYEFLYLLDEGESPCSADGAPLSTVAFPGGLYASLPFDAPDSDYNVTVPTAWRRLDAWVAASPYRPGGHQWLEEMGPDFRLAAMLYAIE